MAEIGVWEGGFSEIILDVTKPKELHLIDPWSFQPEYSNSAFGRARNVDKMAGMYDTVAQKFASDDRVTLHRKMSHEALETFDDHSLDWVYVDGNHNYDIVLNDIQLALKKVKPNGMIAGDDLLWKIDDGAPVRTAVRQVKRQLGEQTRYFRFGQQWLFELVRA